MGTLSGRLGRMQAKTDRQVAATENKKQALLDAQAVLDQAKGRPCGVNVLASRSASAQHPVFQSII